VEFIRKAKNIGRRVAMAIVALTVTAGTVATIVMLQTPATSVAMIPMTPKPTGGVGNGGP